MTIPENNYQKDRPLCINCGTNLFDEMKWNEAGKAIWPDKCPVCRMDPLKLRNYISWKDGSERRLARIFDANGKEYINVWWCRISTGELELSVEFPHNNVLKVPAPLTVIFES